MHCGAREFLFAILFYLSREYFSHSSDGFFQLGSIRRDLAPVLRSSVVKFTVLPAFTFAACLIAGLPHEAAVVVMTFQSLPTASSSYIMARQLGGDGRLMASIIALQTLIAAAAIPVVVTLAARFLG